MTSTTTLSPARIMAALDGARNAFGMELDTEARKRIYAAIETTTGPNWDTERFIRWEDARGIVVSDDVIGGTTLWQAVIRRWGNAYASRTMVPSPYSILEALEQITTPTQKEHSA